jgi:hypothetical protein
MEFPCGFYHVTQRDSDVSFPGAIPGSISTSAVCGWHQPPSLLQPQSALQSFPVTQTKKQIPSNPLAVDDPDPEILSERMAKIAVHELGHAFGLEDMPYDHADCVMCGDTDLDSLDTLDHGSIDFCGPCMRRLQTGLHRSRNRAR